MPVAALELKPPVGNRISLAWPNNATTRRVCSMIRGRFRHIDFMIVMKRQQPNTN